MNGGLRMASLEERIEQLERSRYSQLAQLNALRTMAIGAWVFICRQQSNPEAFASALSDAWLRGAEDTVRDLRPLSAAEIAHVSDLYRSAIEALGSEVRRAVGQKP